VVAAGGEGGYEVAAQPGLCAKGRSSSHPVERRIEVIDRVRVAEAGEGGAAPTDEVGGGEEQVRQLGVGTV